MMPIPKVGIKYCGGCNPEYDRVASVEQIIRALKGKVEFVPAQNEGVEIILAVQGCATACADLSPFKDIEIKLITKAEDAGRFVQELNDIISKRTDNDSKDKVF
jgi:hypothetical protein